MTTFLLILALSLDVVLSIVLLATRRRAPRKLVYRFRVEGLAEANAAIAKIVAAAKAADDAPAP